MRHRRNSCCDGYVDWFGVCRRGVVFRISTYMTVESLEIIRDCLLTIILLTLLAGLFNFVVFGALPFREIWLWT